MYIRTSKAQTLFRLRRLSWLFSESFYTERAIICKLVFDFLLEFCYFVQSPLVAKQTIITFGAANGGGIASDVRKQIDFS